MGQINLKDKDAILVSLYSDIDKLKFDLTAVLSFRRFTYTTLSLLEKEFNSGFEFRHTRRKDEHVDFTQLMEAKGAVYADITNIRFLLKDKPQDTANVQLRGLKVQAQALLNTAEGARSTEKAKLKQDVIVLGDTPTPKKPILVLRTSPSGRSESPSPSVRRKTSKSPIAIELKAKGGNVLNVSSRLTSSKRMEETKKLLKGPLEIPHPPLTSFSLQGQMVPFTTKDSSHTGHVPSAPTTPKRVNELKHTSGSSKSPKSMGVPNRLATKARPSSFIKLTSSTPKIKLKFGGSGSTLGAGSQTRGLMSNKGERKISIRKKKNKARGLITPGGGGVRPRPQEARAVKNSGTVGGYGEEEVEDKMETCE